MRGHEETTLVVLTERNSAFVWKSKKKKKEFFNESKINPHAGRRVKKWG